MNKYVKTFESYLKEDKDFYQIRFENILRRNDYILYHITPTQHIDSILEHGLIPRKNPNVKYDKYSNTIEGVFLTIDSDVKTSKIPKKIVKNNIPLTILKVNVYGMDYMLFDKDDDTEYYGKNHYEKLVKALEQNKSISYKGIIEPSRIEILHSDLNLKNNYDIPMDSSVVKKQIITDIKNYMNRVSYMIKYNKRNFDDLDSFKQFLRDNLILTQSKENAIKDIDTFLEDIRLKVLKLKWFK